ncbi:MAG: 30S ribosomal protein S2 [Candidatus Handelsmanbacteria bacterium]|nr:30S ribosomal protein S2 [Candidatus Handelsmanbacteria bacterium]
MPEIAIRDLLEAGTHFGHQTRRWNPKMRQFIFTERNGIHIIDLQKTAKKIEEAYEAVRKTAQAGRSVLFVGTKKQAVDIIRQEAERCGMFHVTERWLGGMLTNWQTIRQSIRHLDHLDRLGADGSYGNLKKKEVLLLEKERGKLDKVLSGIRKMGALPGLIFMVDIKKEHLAVAEARNLEIPAVAIIDTNCDPEAVTYPIPGNDDALRSIALITHLMAEAVIEGRATSQKGEGRRARQESAAEGFEEEAAPEAEAPASR